MKIGVLLPTVRGREGLLARCVAATCPITPSVEWLLAVELDYPTVAEAWVAGLPRLLEAGADYVLVTCDDFWAVGPWWLEAVKTCDAGAIACPILFNAGAQERWPSSADDGEPGELARCTRSPNLLSSEQAGRIFRVYGRVAEPVQCYADFLIGDIGSRLGIPARVAGGFTFVHHWGQPGRHSDVQNEADDLKYRRALRQIDSELLRG